MMGQRNISQPLNVCLTLMWLGLAIPLHANDTRFTLATATAAAKKGDAQADYFLAKCYARGTEVPRDYIKSAAFMRQAADKGCLYAQNDLGVYYAKGLGVPQSYTNAAKWYRRAATRGDSLAQYSLGLYNLEGRGMATNLSESRHWLGKAAAQEQPDALLILGDLYRTGNSGVPANSDTARRCYETAAACGRPSAYNALGVLFQTGGDGVKKNPDAAFKYFSHAAEGGDADGQLNLAQMYRDGVGIEPDLVTAYQWFYLAALNGNHAASHGLIELDGRLPSTNSRILSPLQITEAVTRAEKIQKSKGWGALN